MTGKVLERNWMQLVSYLYVFLRFEYRTILALVLQSPSSQQKRINHLPEPGILQQPSQLRWRDFSGNLPGNLHPR